MPFETSSPSFGKTMKLHIRTWFARIHITAFKPEMAVWVEIHIAMAVTNPVRALLPAHSSILLAHSIMQC